MTIRFLKPLCLFCAFGTMMLTPVLSAQRQDPTSETAQEIALDDHSEKCIAELSETVDLNEDQELKVREVYLQNKIVMEPIWEKYNQAQKAAVNIEAEMYFTMEALMTDAQQQTFTAARKSQQETMAAGTYTPDASKKINETSGRTEKDQADNGDKPEPTQDSDEESLTPSESYVQKAIISPMKQLVVTLGLDSEERAKCKSACGTYHTRLNTAWTEIHNLRNELVNQKSKTIKAVASILTKEQISKLEKHRALLLETETSGSFFDR